MAINVGQILVFESKKYLEQLSLVLMTPMRRYFRSLELERVPVTPNDQLVPIHNFGPAAHISLITCTCIHPLWQAFGSSRRSCCSRAAEKEGTNGIIDCVDFDCRNQVVRKMFSIGYCSWRGFARCITSHAYTAVCQDIYVMGCSL